MGKTAKETALKILKEEFVGTMSTIRENKPQSRYMTFFNEDFTLFTVTSEDTLKMDDLSENPNTHILLGYDGEGYGDAYLEIEGTVERTEHDKLKEQAFEHAKGSFAKNTELSDLVVLKITPDHIRLLNKTGEEPQEIDF